MPHKNILYWLLVLVPRRLPTTQEQFEELYQRLLALGQYPDNGSFRHALSTMILHIPPGQIFASDMEFYKNLRRSITNQIAYGVMQDEKAKEAAAKRTTVLDVN